MSEDRSPEEIRREADEDIVRQARALDRRLYWRLAGYLLLIAALICIAGVAWSWW